MKLPKVAAAAAIIVACAPNAMPQERGYIAAPGDCRANPSELARLAERLSKGEPPQAPTMRGRVLARAGCDPWRETGRTGGPSPYTHGGPERPS